MKLCAVSALLLPAAALANESFWTYYIKEVDSMPTPNPTPRPTPFPTPEPTPLPTPNPTPGPSGEPSPSPSESPSDPPSPSPSDSPSESPSEAPSPSPSESPSKAPSPSPSESPSEPPSQPPTGSCSIDASLSCTTITPGGGFDGTGIGGLEVPCDEITEELEPICSCAECVRALSFIYTGKPCSSTLLNNGKCTENGPNPFIAGYRITDALDQTSVLATGIVQQGDEITFESIGDGCIPDTLAVSISVPTGGVTQTFTIDSSCDRRGLILTEDYGAFESYGYACDDNDVHNCGQTVTYDLRVCNDGTEEQTVYEFSFKQEEELTGAVEMCDLTEEATPADLMIAPGECFIEEKKVDLNRCSGAEYCAEVMASATNPITGVPPNCPGEDEAKFEWPDIPPVPDTPSPTPSPTRTPTPAPTSTCIIDVALSGCPEPDLLLNQNCEGRPQVITFRYNGADCSQSDNFQPRQKFTCQDFGSGPPTTPGTLNYIYASEDGVTSEDGLTFTGDGGDIYFQGPVPVGDKYTLNQDKSQDKLSADMVLEIFDTDPAFGGQLLQRTNVHLSCSQALFLFDRFGSSQVTEWIEVDGRIVTDEQLNVPSGNITVELDTLITKPVVLRDMRIIANTGQIFDYSDEIDGVILEPGAAIQLEPFVIDIELGREVEYLFFTTIIGETLDGTDTCNGNSFLSCIVGFNLGPIFPTTLPTPRPTLTQFPTGLPETTPCAIAAEIRCSVVYPVDNVISCDRLRGGVSATCPADERILKAYLQYDGRFGPSVFIVPTCDKNEYQTRTVLAGEIYEFSTRASDVCEVVTFTIYDEGDLLGNNGNELASADVAIPCPGPWTIGTEIAPGFTLAYYVSTPNGGTTFNFNVLDAQLSFDYVARNLGRIPLIATSGQIDAPFPFDSGSVETGLPVTIPQQQSTVLLTDTDVISLTGTEPFSYTFSVTGTTANSFANPCAGTAQYILEL